MRNVQAWTMSEIETLWIYFQDSTISKLRKLFPGRSDKSINKKAKRIGLRKEPYVIAETGRENQKLSYTDQFTDMTEDVLTELYITQRKSSKEIGELFGCNSKVVLKRLHRFGIEIRKDSSYYTSEERKEKWARYGADHPRWRGGVTEANGLIRNRIARVSLARFKQDGFKCVECGGGEHKLHAHHLRPFSEIVAEIRSENGLEDLTEWDAKEHLANICANDERLLDVDNLVTLCEECHKSEHSRQRESEAV